MCELLIPVVILLALGGLRNVVKPTTIGPSVPSTISYNAYNFNLGQMYVAVDYDYRCIANLVFRCNEADSEDYTKAWSLNSCGDKTTDPITVTGNSKCQPMKIAVLPDKSTNAANAVAAAALETFANTYAARQYQLQNGSYNMVASRRALELPLKSYSTFKYFASESAFDDYIGSDSYSLDGGDIYSAAIIITSAAPDWAYTIRINQTSYYGGRSSYVDSPPTDKNPINIAIKDPESSVDGYEVPYLDNYVGSGYLVLGDIANSFITTFTCRANGKCGSDDQYTSNLYAGVPFPYPETTVAAFWTYFGSLFGFIMVMVLLFPFSNMIKSLVLEKEHKLREGMQMMSLRGDALWISWWLHFFCLILPLAILCLLASYNLFPESDTSIIFIYYFVFFLSATSYSIFVSTFFSKARTAALVGSLVFFCGFFIYIGMATAQVKDRGALLAACLHPATAFIFGTLAFAEYEDAKIGVTYYTWNTSDTQAITFQDTINMMFIDSIWMLFLAYYFGSIWPSEFGTHKPWYFILLPSFWKSYIESIFSFFCGCFFTIRKSTSNVRNYAALKPINTDYSVEMAFVEEVTTDLSEQLQKKSCVDIQNLYKEFVTPTGTKVAVDHLNLTMYSGQITALLGHNGAGKTTTIAILTGLIPPDKGSAIVEGFDINVDMDVIRQNLGVCPQHDILFPDLTVREHLIMFCCFKGVTGNKKINEEVNAIISSVGLTEKANIRSSKLSGGQKRKLSVGIAFIGGSRVIFLDEPTSGMDPYSRRFTWNVIRQYKEGRVVVLTTHFMDEADLLGDRIAIMGDGKLKCCGSSIFLKKMYGVGYNMTVEKKDPVAFNTDNMIDIVTSRVPDAKVLTDVGTEITFQLPFSSTSKFQGLFELIDSRVDLGVESYGMSVTTLEEVFIKVAHGTKTQSRQNEDKIAIKATSGKADDTTDVELALLKKDHYHFDFERIDEKNIVEIFVKHMYAMYRKRFLYFIRDTRTWILQFFIPFVFVLIGIVITIYSVVTITVVSKKMDPRMYNDAMSTNYFPMVYNPEMFNTSYTYPSSGITYTYVDKFEGYCYYHPDHPFTPKKIMEQISSAASFPVRYDNSIATIKEVSQSIWDYRNALAASQIGAFTFSDVSYGKKCTAAYSNEYMEYNDTMISYMMHSNYTARYGPPVIQALLGSGMINAVASQTSTLSVTYAPLPLTSIQATLQTSYVISYIVDFILIAVVFVPAVFSAYVVREREVKAKHVQFVSGISVPGYWLSTWIWDVISYQITAWSIIFLVAVFPNTELLSGKDAIGPLIGLMVLFGTSITGFCYMTSFLFKSPAGAQIANVGLMFILGFVLSIVGIVLRLFPETQEPFKNYVRYILLLFPPYALGDGLFSLTSIKTYSLVENVDYKPYSWMITGLPLAFMAWESFVYIVLTILIEYSLSVPSIQALVAGGNTVIPEDNTVRDDDVLAEERRCASGDAVADSVILVKDIKKVYPDGKYAVRGVSLGIPNGECFGLLGINGAGKSTTLSILSGEFGPSSGEAFLGGLSLAKDIHQCRRKIGFCPQFDALFELLTGREHLELYARIKGIVERDIPGAVENKILEMGLKQYADNPAGTYSGGNKRKLSVAIAMIGDPSIVFLDEPSTGMDPVAKRFMWEVITNIVTKRAQCSVILTTHSMEECDALCTRIGIMVGGVLRCLGSGQRLRSKYGHGYQVEIKFNIPSPEMMSDECRKILVSINVPVTDKDLEHFDLTRAQMEQFFKANSKAFWVERVCRDGNGSDLFASLEGTSAVGIKLLANFSIFETAFDALTAFLVKNFGTFSIKERQTNKVRLTLPSTLADGSKRALSSLFGMLEASKAELSMQEYSISQTSLEQIFNEFASQQDEEKVGKQVDDVDPSSSCCGRSECC